MSRPAFYTRDGARYVPTGMAGNPWISDAQSGVALGGLVAQLLAAVPDPVPMVTARLLIDILGVVPNGPLDAAVRITREGRRLRFVEAELSHAGRPCVRATAMRVRAAGSPAAAAPLVRPLPGAADAPSTHEWFETVRVAGDFGSPGPGARWIRVTADIVAGEPADPLALAAVVADFGTGTAPIVSPADWTFANIDIGLYLTRAPRDGWLLIDCDSEGAGNGIGITTSRMGDRDGMFGVAHQTSFLNRR